MHITLDGIGPVAMGVLITLLAMSVLSIGIMAERLWAFRQAVTQSRRYAAEAAVLLRQGRLADALGAARAKAVALAHVPAVVAAGATTTC